MSARSYLVGLPVLVTVTDEGVVTYDIDTSEAGVSVREEAHEQAADQEEQPDEAQILADYEAIEADHKRRWEASQ